MIWHWYWKSYLMEDKDPFILHRQYHGCWWPGDARSQGMLRQMCYGLNTLRPRQNGHHFPEDIFKCIFWKENVWISINFSLKFVPKGSISNIPALVQIMAWRRLGDKPLSEPMLTYFPTHKCVSRPQWVNAKYCGLYTRGVNTLSIFWIVKFITAVNLAMQEGRALVIMVLIALPWWRHQMETFSELLALCAGSSLVTGEFPTQRPVIWSFDVFFDLHLNKLLS